MSRYIHQIAAWPTFNWSEEKLSNLLATVRFSQGKLIGHMGALGFSLQTEAMLQTLTLDVLKSNEIEGEVLNQDQVRSSIARQLGMEIGGLVPADKNVEGVVEMMLDATQHYDKPLSTDRLFSWHTALFPSNQNSVQKLIVGAWRDNGKGSMQVVSGPLGRERVHFEAPDALLVEQEMSLFIKWFNGEMSLDPIVKAGVAHLWFVTIHPFDDGNGRIARAIADMQLSRADGTHQRFYSMSAQIQRERKAYYDILEKTQKGTLDITNWLEWFLSCLGRALKTTEETLSGVLQKARFWEKYAKTIFHDRQILMLNKLLDSFEGKLTTSKWAKIAKCSSDTALRDIQDLVERGVLVKDSSGGRSTNYLLAE